LANLLNLDKHIKVHLLQSWTNQSANVVLKGTVVIV